MPSTKNPYICIVKQLWALTLHVVEGIFRKSSLENI